MGAEKREGLFALIFPLTSQSDHILSITLFLGYGALKAESMLFSLDVLLKLALARG